MKAYIYFFVNKFNRKRYVGQTTNFSRRKKEHLTKLREHTHVNAKLQAAFDKYGEESFEWIKITYDDTSKEDLDEQEIFFIKKCSVSHCHP